MDTRRNPIYEPLWLIILLGIVTSSQDAHAHGMHTRASGVCQHYEGMCSEHLNSTEHRYINTTLGLNGTESIAGQLLIAVQSIYDKGDGRKRCKPILEKTVCFFVFPFCSPGETRLDYCREDCRHLFEICGTDLNRLVGAGKALLFGQLSGLVFRFDQCKELKSVDDTSDRNTTCRQLPYIDIPPPTSDSSEMLNTDVIVAIAVGVPLVIFFLLLCGLHHRRLSNKARLNSIHYENGEAGIKNARLSTVVSMRDRIREWKVAPSELIELVDICKSRGVLEIPVDNIEYLKDLGSGQYGLVFQGKVIEDMEGETSNIVAVKTLREGSSEDAIKEFCQEVNIMSTFSHPNVVKLIGVSLGGEPYCMIFEFVEFGDLASFLRNCDDLAEEKDSAYPKLTVTDQLAMAVQIASGMKYISSIRCVHRDLAARNCLVGRGLVVKISDFGLSRDVYVSEYYRMDKTRMLPVRWLPPEAFVDGKFTTPSDVYSYGVVLWEVFTFAMLPYEEHDNTKTMELILEGNLLLKPEGCPIPVYDIMLKCWHCDPEKRILFPEIINELCSLDDFGQRFEAEIDQIHENFKARTYSENGKLDSGVSLSYTNESCNAYDEQPINVERLPAQPITKKPAHYSIPLSKKANVVTLPEATNDEPEHGWNTNEVEAPRAVHPLTPPPDNLGTYGDVQGSGSREHDDHDGPQETYDVPPKHEESDGETYSVPPIPRHGYNDTDPQETYAVPPSNQEYPDGPEETYSVPPSRDEPQDTYDVPPVSHGNQEYPDGPQETYDVPPGTMKRPLIQNDEIDRDNDVQQETYDVPPKQQEDTGDDIYENSLQVKKPGAHYSVPQSPFLKRRNENKSNENNNTPPSSRNPRHSYENVDFDGKPLIPS